MKKVLVLCTGNSCRSILAEAMINHYLKDHWQAFSAGTQPSVVNPKALKVLQELGIDTSGFRSKSVTEFLDRDDLDLVITVCDNARETCPVFLKPVKQVHIGIEDPAPYSDEPEESSLPRFRAARDSIRAKILTYLDRIV
ncbi:MAG: arsenate reductase ArsC [Candidatus Cloacimonadaceae bacterium]